MKPDNWTPELDRLLETTIAGGGSYAAAASLISRKTRGAFSPHPTTCMRRLTLLRERASRASPRGDAAPRRRSDRLAPPNVNVYALTFGEYRPALLDIADRLSEMLLALPAGWTWEHVVGDEDMLRGAFQSAQHQANLRGDTAILLESPSHRGSVRVGIVRAGRVRVDVHLAVVRFARRAS